MMSATIAELMARLMDDVSPIDGVPSIAQYRQALIDAVSDLGRRSSMVRQATIAVAAGVATYGVPADLLKPIALEQIGASFGSDGGGIFITPAGLVPFTGAYRETVTLIGDQLHISPPPAASADRTLVYAAGDALSGETFPTLTAERARIALLLAGALCLDMRALSPGGQAVKVTSDGDTIDTGPAVAAVRALAQDRRSAYMAAVQALNAQVGGLG